MAPSTILLKGGTVLVHDNDNHVTPIRADVLIEGSLIADIQEGITPPSNAKVIDCTGKLVSPGFIDTHHHVWQTHLKGRHADDTLMEYMATGNFPNALHTPDDIFWGQLSGALEMIDAGTTTVVDHAHLNYSAEHSEQAIRATVASGIRSIFGYCPTPRVAEWKPAFKLEQDFFPPWVMETWDRLAGMNPFGPNGRVRLGFAFDGLFLPAEMLRPLFEKVRKSGSQLITTHGLGGAMTGGGGISALQILSAGDLLASDILISHANRPTEKELALLRSSGAHFSSTPSTELQMALGNPACLMPGFTEHSSLGVDCHSACGCSIPSQMMLVLQWARGRRHEEFESKGKWAKTVGPEVEAVFNLGTILGAKAVGMEKEIGSLKKGKKADIVIFEGSTPSMLAAAQRNPVAAIVLHSSIRDMSTVIVDGVVRKENGQLLDVQVPKDLASHGTPGGEEISWQNIAQKVAKGRDVIEEKIRTQTDKELAVQGTMAAFYLNTAALADSV